MYIDVYVWFSLNVCPVVNPTFSFLFIRNAQIPIFWFQIIVFIQVADNHFCCISIVQLGKNHHKPHYFDTMILLPQTFLY